MVLGKCVNSHITQGLQAWLAGLQPRSWGRPVVWGEDRAEPAFIVPWAFACNSAM